MSQYQQSYYERVTKPKRDALRAEKMAREGKPRLKRGPARRRTSDTLILHLKFTGELRQYIEKQCRTQEYQAFFERLVQDEFLRISENSSNS